MKARSLAAFLSLMGCAETAGDNRSDAAAPEASLDVRTLDRAATALDTNLLGQRFGTSTVITVVARARRLIEAAVFAGCGLPFTDRAAACVRYTMHATALRIERGTVLRLSGR
jgi:hypothetical protein